jgi:hypothetical protein
MCFLRWALVVVARMPLLARDMEEPVAAVQACREEAMAAAVESVAVEPMARPKVWVDPRIATMQQASPVAMAAEVTVDPAMAVPRKRVRVVGVGATVEMVAPCLEMVEVAAVELDMPVAAVVVADVGEWGVEVVPLTSTPHLALERSHRVLEPLRGNRAMQTMRARELHLSTGVW